MRSTISLLSWLYSRCTVHMVGIARLCCTYEFSGYWLLSHESPEVARERKHHASFIRYPRVRAVEELEEPSLTKEDCHLTRVLCHATACHTPVKSPQVAVHYSCKKCFAKRSSPKDSMTYFARICCVDVKEPPSNRVSPSCPASSSWVVKKSLGLNIVFVSPHATKLVLKVIKRSVNFIRIT